MEMGNGKREMKRLAFPSYLHALFAFSNTSSGADFCHSGEEVETIAYASA